MKTIFIDCSPKKRLSASGFIAAMTKWFVFGKKVQCRLRTPKDYKMILDEIRDADAVVFSMPLYVDGVPSHVLPFLKKICIINSKENGEIWKYKNYPQIILKK